MDYTIIKTLRIENDITLEEVAQDIGLTRAGVSLIERGISKPHARTAYKLDRWIEKLRRST